MKYLSLDGLSYFWQSVKNTFYSATNQPPYPVTSVNGQTGDVTVAGGGAVTSVNNKTGAVTITKSDVGLGDVDNTADANKPISTAMQTALNAKSNTGHTHTKSQISDFPSSLPANGGNADTVDNKHASDFAPAPTVLYNNTSGSNSTITLSQSAANFTHMRIYYNSDNSSYQSVDVYNPSGKVVGLFVMDGDVNNMYYKFAQIYINGTSVTFNSNGHGWIPNGGTNNINATSEPIRILSIEAWN